MTILPERIPAARADAFATRAAPADVQFICPECRQPLARTEARLHCANGHSYSVDGAVYNLLPPSVNQLALADAEYHAAQKETWIDLNQCDAYRNVYYHEALLRKIAAACSERSRILEIGGGVGFDLGMFLRLEPRFALYVFSEIASSLAAYAAAQYRDERVLFGAIDAQHLPFPDAYFDCVYMMAALHHLEDIPAAMRELVRVTRPGGLICCGIEPNTAWVRLIAGTKVVWRRLLPQRAHSPADEQAHGLTIADFERLARSYGLTLQSLEPVWLLCGFFHYGLEFVYRLLRMKRRLRLPRALEKVLVASDRALLRLPGMEHLSWHYTAVYRKP